MKVSVGPHVMNVEEAGDGDPVICVHASGFSSRQWRRLSEKLAATGRHVLAVDLIGSGKSTPWPDGERFHFSLDLRGLETLSDAVGPAHVVGHSYGGFLAALLALHRPRAVRSLALYEPVTFGILRSRGEQALIDALPRLPDEPGEAWMTGFVDWWNGPGAWAALPGGTRAAFLACANKVFGEVRSLGADETPHQALALIDAPALVMGGARSTATERRVVALLGETLPRARVEICADAGHMGPLTHTDAVNALIEGHLNGG